MGSRRIKEHEETNITNVGTKSIVSEKEKKIRKKKPITKKVVNKKNINNVRSVFRVCLIVLSIHYSPI